LARVDASGGVFPADHRETEPPVLELPSELTDGDGPVLGGAPEHLGAECIIEARIAGEQAVAPDPESGVGGGRVDGAVPVGPTPRDRGRIDVEPASRPLLRPVDAILDATGRLIA
jgi:hypothetical protein